MNSQVLAAPLPSSSRKRSLLIALLAAVAGAAIAAGVLTASGGDGADAPQHAKELRGPAFALAYPAGWAPARAGTLAKLPGRPAAAVAPPAGGPPPRRRRRPRRRGPPAALVRRADGKGVVVVRRKAAPRN